MASTAVGAEDDVKVRERRTLVRPERDVRREGSIAEGLDSRRNRIDLVMAASAFDVLAGVMATVMLVLDSTQMTKNFA